MSNDFDNMFGSDDLDNSLDFGSTEDDFGSFGESSDFGSDSSDFSSDSSDMDFSNSISDMSQPEETNALKKNSWIFIVIGAVVIMVVIIVATSVSKHKAKEKVANNSGQATITSTQNVNQDANDIMGTNKNNSNTSNKDNNSVNINAPITKNDEWKEITSDENIEFTGESDLEFTITGITHKAKAIDTNKNLVVKTTLQGSLSGLSGVYELDVPYDKGSKLVVGQHFTVKVQLGQYKGKTVVGNISY